MSLINYILLKRFQVSKKLFIQTQILFKIRDFEGTLYLNIICIHL